MKAKETQWMSETLHFPIKICLCNFHCEYTLSVVFIKYTNMQQLIKHIFTLYNVYIYKQTFTYILYMFKVCIYKGLVTTFVPNNLMNYWTDFKFDLLNNCKNLYSHKIKNQASVIIYNALVGSKLHYLLNVIVLYFCIIDKL